MKEKILHNIKTIRESKNLSEDFIGTQIGIHQSTYCKKEKGDNDFTLTEILKLSDVMQVPVTRFFDLDIAKVINQNNHDNSTGFVEHQIISDEGFKAALTQAKDENIFLREQVKKMTSLLKKYL